MDIILNIKVSPKIDIKLDFLNWQLYPTKQMPKNDWPERIKLHWSQVAKYKPEVDENYYDVDFIYFPTIQTNNYIIKFLLFTITFSWTFKTEWFNRFSRRYNAEMDYTKCLICNQKFDTTDRLQVLVHQHPEGKNVSNKAEQTEDLPF